MRYICCQPSTLYYSWQVDTMLLSFIQTGINQNQIDIVLADRPNEVEHFLELQKKYPNVNFYFYPDTRTKFKYISTVRPHILAKHFYKHPDLYKGTFMYHDSDIVFTKPLDINKYLCGCNKTCYLSDTIGYIGYEYIKSKGEDVLDLMCKVVGIEKEIVKNNEKNSGGAQYILKDIDYKFWLNVEKDSENLFNSVVELNKKKQLLNKDYHPLQIWCADMWAVLWNLWKIGKKTEVVPELDFTWATESIKSWYKKSIYHNAGVTPDKEGYFYKANYVKNKPPKNLNINKNNASYNYYELVKQIL